MGVFCTRANKDLRLVNKEILIRRTLTWLCFTAVLATTLFPARAQDEKPALDVKSGVWHLGFNGLFGSGVRRGQPYTKNLDIYPMFVDGKMVNALATGRRFNTSIHILERNSIIVDPEAMTIAGEAEILMTPDPWIPQDGKAFIIAVELDGTLKEHEQGISISGTFTAVRPDGGDLMGQKGPVTGKLSGSVGVTEPNWENSVWTANCSQHIDKDTQIKHDAIAISLGVADGKVNWGTNGLTAQPAWGTYNPMPFDVSKFSPVDPAGMVTGEFEVTERHLHPAGDPNNKVTIRVDARRIQGLNGMKGVIIREDGSKVAFAGRGKGDVEAEARVLSINFGGIRWTIVPGTKKSKDLNRSNLVSILACCSVRRMCPRFAPVRKRRKAKPLSPAYVGYSERMVKGSRITSIKRRPTTSTARPRGSRWTPLPPGTRRVSAFSIS